MKVILLRVIPRLSKAFDIVNHTIILEKLHHYGIRGHVHNWFKSYLGSQKQCTVVNHARFELGDINTCVPHGSVLRPVLCLMYVNDIENVTKEINEEIMLFANDSNVFMINKDLNLEEWFAFRRVVCS